MKMEKSCKKKVKKNNKITKRQHFGVVHLLFIAPKQKQKQKKKKGMELVDFDFNFIVYYLFFIVVIKMQ